MARALAAPAERGRPRSPQCPSCHRRQAPSLRGSTRSRSGRRALCRRLALRARLCRREAADAIRRRKRCCGGRGRPLRRRGRSGLRPWSARLGSAAAGLAEHLTGLDRDAAKVGDANVRPPGCRPRFAVADLATAPVPACDTAFSSMSCTRCRRGHADAPARTRGHGGPKPRADPGFRSRPRLARQDRPRHGMGSAGRSAVTAPRSVRCRFRQLRHRFEAAGFSVSVTPCWAAPPCRTCCWWPSGHRHEPHAAGRHPGLGLAASAAAWRSGNRPRPLLEMGAFGGGAVLPDYPAAGQSHRAACCCPG